MTDLDDGRAASAPVPQEHRETLERLDRWATILDGRFHIPFTKIRFGLDPIIGLIPGAGDVVGFVLGLYIFYHARRMGAPLPLQLRMLRNSGVNMIAGVVPVAGNMFDVYWRSNSKNVDLLQEHFIPEVVLEEDRGRWPWLRNFLIFILFLIGLAIFVYFWKHGFVWPWHWRSGTVT